MITIRVVSCNGEAPARPLAVEFDELGGTIGRAETNQLVLPDPERHISRLQARVAWRNGSFEIANVGANPLDVAGQSIANGASTTIEPGDRITVGGYLLEVSAGGSGPAPSPAAEGAGPSAAKDDPLGLFGGLAQGGPGEDPFASILAGAVGAAVPPMATEAPARSPSAVPAERPASAPSVAGASASAPVIPEDFDPFADPFAQAPAAKLASENLDDLGFGASGESVSGPGISTIFGLERGARAGTAADLLAGTPLAAPAPGKDDKGALLDPLAALSGAARAEPKQAAVPDQVPEIRAAYRPPAAKLPDDAFLSWEQAGAGKAAESAEPAEAPSPRPRADVEIAPSSGAETTKGSERLPGAEAVPEPPPTPVAPPAGESDALLQAFLQGLGLPGLKLEQGLTPEAMQTIGQLLREATQGTLDLLLARATTKREVRAEVTMIVSRDNNPLKFSPSVEVALMHLLAPQGRGFLPPLAAMRDAWDDLRAHQLGFMAGMRAALAGVLQRFDPATLEQRLSAKSLLDSLLPMNRRAHLWELYISLYREIAREAEDDFHALFGREFVRAYEEQVRRLHAADE